MGIGRHQVLVMIGEHLLKRGCAEVFMKETLIDINERLFKEQLPTNEVKYLVDSLRKE